MKTHKRQIKLMLIFKISQRALRYDRNSQRRREEEKRRSLK
jgi:hypothetical protein